MTDTALNLVVIRSADIEHAAEFYRALGLSLEKHRHDNGAEHYAAESETLVFEIYPRKSENDSTAAARLGFRVASVDAMISGVENAGGRIVTAPHDSEWGRRAVVEDFDGHRLELTQKLAKCVLD